MGIDNVNILKGDPNPISDMGNYIRSRQNKGKTQQEIAKDLRERGYDLFSIQSFILMYWTFPDD